MRVRVDHELQEICRTILEMDRSEDEWAEDESWDHFQSETVCGGFDACDRKFTFGKYENGEEVYAVQFSLEQVPLILRGIMQAVETVEYSD